SESRRTTREDDIPRLLRLPELRDLRSRDLVGWIEVGRCSLVALERLVAQRVLVERQRIRVGLRVLDPLRRRYGFAGGDAPDPLARRDRRQRYSSLLVDAAEAVGVERRDRDELAVGRLESAHAGQCVSAVVRDDPVD